MNPSTELKRGHLLRDFALPDGRLLSDVRGRRSLVLLYGDAQAIAPLAQATAAHEPEMKDLEAALLVVFRSGAGPGARLIVDDGSIARALARQNHGTDPAWAALVTDRFGEIFFAAVGSRGDSLPTAADLFSWLDFVARTCEECHPPEWPVL